MRIFLVVVCLALLASIGAAAAALRAYSPLRQATTALHSAVSDVRGADTAAAVAALASARVEFARASHDLGSWWADPAEMVPGVREHLAAMRVAAEVGKEVSAAGERLAPAVGSMRSGFGPTMLARMSSLQRQLGATTSVLARAELQLDSVRSGWLVSPVANRLASAIATLRRGARDTETAREVLTVAEEMLGAAGPRRYFLAVENEAELRGLGGILGNYGVIEADRGHLSLLRFGRDGNLNAAGHPDARRLSGPAAYLALYGATYQPARFWQNVLVSPDLPMDASAIEQLYPQSGGSRVQGVVVLDAAGVAALLSIVGPVSVPSWPAPITSANAVSILLHDEYERLSDAARVAFLGQVAAAVWQRLASAKLGSLSGAARVLSTAVSEKHLLFSSTDPATERLLKRLGAAGVLSRPAGDDFLGVLDDNAGGNKLDYYLRRSISYAVNLGGDGSLAATARITLRNLAPAHGEIPYVGGSVADPSAPLDTNETIVSLYTPWAFTAATLDGAPVPLSSEREDGLDVYSTPVTLPPGASATIEVHLRGTLSLHGTYRLELFRQPAAAPDGVRLEVHTSGARVVGESSPIRRTSSASAEAQLSLASDQVLRIRLAG